MGCNLEALEVFGLVGEVAEDIMYINWLMMVRTSWNFTQDM